MTKQTGYESLAQAQIEEWRAEIGLLKAQAKRADAKTQIEVHKAIEQVEHHYDRAKSELTGTAGALEEALAGLKTGVEQAWADIKRADGRAADRLDADGSGG